jgi:hypothetical protein
MIEEGDMKRRTVFGLIMILIGLGLIIYAGISATIFRFQNIDMTDMRLFIENPAPSILVIVGYIMTRVGISFAKR